MNREILTKGGQFDFLQKEDAVHAEDTGHAEVAEDAVDVVDTEDAVDVVDTEDAVDKE